jgi:CRISPR/Cas system-associated protein Cas5 (RAMP superfamily)
MIDNDQFYEWVYAFDKKDFKLYQKQNIQPFESIFLRLGAVVLKNIKNYLAANPDSAVQNIKRSLSDLVKQLQTSDNIETIKKLETELKKIERIGGFDTIVPIEGIVFTYGGNTYKLTGSFAPVNQILGVLKYAR